MPELQRRGTILRTAAQCGADEASIQRFIDALANDIQMAPVHRLSLSEMESIFQAGQSHGASIYRTSQLTRTACASPLRAVVQGRPPLHHHGAPPKKLWNSRQIHPLTREQRLLGDPPPETGGAAASGKLPK